MYGAVNMTMYVIYLCKEVFGCLFEIIRQTICLHHKREASTV